MSDIHLTSIAKLQQLNCNKGQTTTTSAIQEIDSSSNTIFLLLQDPWLTNSGQPPSSNQYDLLRPPGNTPRYPTYVRKHLRLDTGIHAHYKLCILSIVVEIADRTIEIMNVYAPSTQEGNHFLKNHHPHSNTIRLGDISCHHNLWYAELAIETRIYNMI